MARRRNRSDARDESTAALAPVELDVAIPLASIFLLVYLLLGHGNFLGTDEISVFETTRAIFEHGSLALEPGLPHRYPGSDGRYYAHFAVGQSVLALPLYASAKLARAILPPAWAEVLAGPAWWKQQPGAFVGSGSLEIAAVSLYGPLASALLVALFFVFSRQLGARLRPALIATFLLGLSTYVVALSGMFLRHPSEALAILASLFYLHRYRLRGRISDAGLGSFFASSLLWIRIPALIAAPGLAAYALACLYERNRGRPRSSLWATLGAFAAPPIMVLTIHAILNHALWGSWLGSPMLEQRSFFTTPLLVGVWGLLLSPGASIFVYSPPLLLVFAAAPRFLREHRAEGLTIFGISLCFLLVCAKFDVFTGVWSAMGPRYLYALVPLSMLVVVPWLSEMRTRRARFTVGALAAAGVVVQLLATLGRWPDVILVMHYEQFADPDDFVFLPQMSPLIGALRLVSAGQLDAWIWRVGQGWPGHAGAPAIALSLFGIWLLAFAACARQLQRAISAHEAAH